LFIAGIAALVSGSGSAGSGGSGSAGTSGLGSPLLAPLDTGYGPRRSYTADSELDAALCACCGAAVVAVAALLSARLSMWWFQHPVVLHVRRSAACARSSFVAGVSVSTSYSYSCDEGRAASKQSKQPWSRQSVAGAGEGTHALCVFEPPQWLGRGGGGGRQRQRQRQRQQQQLQQQQYQQHVHSARAAATATPTLEDGKHSSVCILLAIAVSALGWWGMYLITLAVYQPYHHSSELF
jgi:hypothetical protein